MKKRYIQSQILVKKNWITYMKIRKEIIMFGEKEKEYDTKSGKEIPVFKSPKYLEAKDKAQEMIKSEKYDLTEGDFWILMNKTKTEKMMYSGLIISHNGCLKINNKIENKVDPSKFTLDKEGYNKSLVFTYCDNDIYEVGEVSPTNCKNEYPYAMAYKRCFDRVVLKKSQLAYAGVYSDSEADEFTKNDDIEEDTNRKLTDKEIDILTKTIVKYNLTDEEANKILTKYGYKELKDIDFENYAKIGNEMSK